MKLKEEYIEKIMDAGFEIVSLTTVQTKTKDKWQVHTCAMYKCVKDFYNKKKDAVRRYKDLLERPLVVTDSLTKDDREKLINKGFTLYRLRADNSIWFQDVCYREWKLFSKFTAEDQAKKELAELVKNEYALED